MNVDQRGVGHGHLEFEADELSHLVESTRANQFVLAGDDETLLVAKKLRFLILLVFISVSASVIVSPSTNFVKLTFFAGSHNTSYIVGGGDCQLTPASEACRKASSDVAVYHGVSGAFAHSVAWLFALMLGSVSDAHGRRPILVAASFLSLMSRLSLASHLFEGRSLWWYLVVEPILTIFDCHGVYLAVMNDLVREQRQRIVANSVVMGSVLVAGGMAGLLGGALPAKTAVVISLLLGTGQVVFLFTGFPETVPVQLRGGIENMGKSDLNPFDLVRDTAQVLTKNSFTFRITMVFFLSALGVGGFHTVFFPYLSAYLGFNQRENGQLMLAGAISTVVAFAFGMRPLVAAHGEIGASRILLAMKVVFYLICIAAWTAEQQFVVHILLFGPCLLIVPIMSAIQSNLVNDEEQGRMQGILTAIKVLATAVGDIFFTWFYKFSTSGGANPKRASAFPPLLTATALGFLSFLLSSTLNHRDMSKSTSEKADEMPTVYY